MNEVQVKEIVRGIIREEFKQSLLEARGIPKLFLKIEAVKKEIDRLTAERKSKFGGEYARKLNAETDPKKRDKLKEPILAISKKISSYQKNLADLYEKEEQYIQNLDKDAELELTEMGQNDVHFKNILRMYDHGGSFSKKKVAVAVCKNPNANRSKIIDYLKDMDYQEITQVEDELRIGESVNESIITEDINSLYLAVVLVAQAAALAGNIAAASGNYSGGERLGPIDSIKKWWKDRKDDKAIKSIISKIKTDPEMIEFFKLSQSQQRGKFRKLVASKLSNDEIQYLNRINKSDLQKEGVVNEAEYETYYKTYSGAIQSALNYAKKKGYDLNDDEVAREVGMGPKKPSEGKTNKISLSLTKNFKPQKKMLHIQVYGMKNSYELNTYIQ